MEITTLQLTAQVCHLLDQVESLDPQIQENIESLRFRVKALINLCESGHEIAARVGLEILSPEIDEIISHVALRDTFPPDPQTND